jgi:hypothetical protein
MASIIWNRDPQEAMNNPYEYNAQKQFHREATSLSERLSEIIVSKNHFTIVEQSLAKATWLLQTDALHAFKDAVELLEIKKHKVVGRLLRDILETIHLVTYLNSGYKGADNSLMLWYQDEPRTDSLFRQYIKATLGTEEHERHRGNYEALSKFTHRTYKVLLYGYSGKGDSRLHYDNKWSLPGTIAMYYALLGWIGLMLITNLTIHGVLEIGEIDSCWNQAIEAIQIPRGYLSEEDRAFLGIDETTLPQG